MGSCSMGAGYRVTVLHCKKFWHLFHNFVNVFNTSKHTLKMVEVVLGLMAHVCNRSTLDTKVGGL
jgi:hypothetical protein